MQLLSSFFRVRTLAQKLVEGFAILLVSFLFEL
jgi:hypothetical protein